LGGGDGQRLGCRQRRESCENLTITVKTNEPRYAPGQTVIISVTQANEGPVARPSRADGTSAQAIATITISG
jgi:hypothetical protein